MGNIFENMGKIVMEFSERISKFSEDINIQMSLDTWQGFFEFIQNIPDDVKNTQFLRMFKN